MTSTIHPQTRMGAVKLKVSNLERSIHFYEEIVGLKILTKSEKEAQLTADGKKALVILAEVPNANMIPTRRVSGLYHFALLVPTRVDLGLTLRRLVEKDVSIGQADHNVSEALYISDPDHNGIEIYYDRPRESWIYDQQGNIVMVTDPIDWEGLLQEAEGHEWVGLPAGTTMGHIHLQVSDLTQSREFYCDLLGFEIVSDAWENRGALFIAAGGYHHHLGLNIWAGRGVPEAPEGSIGLDYATIVLPNQQELTKVVDRLKEAGKAVTEDDGAMFVKDPSGIKLKLISA